MRKVVSIVISFPDNIVINNKVASFFTNYQYDYRVFCWDSNDASWKFWAKQLSESDKSKVTVSGLANIKSYKIVIELFNVIWFLFTHFRLFLKHRNVLKNKNLKQYLIALLDDYKLLMQNPDIIHFEFGTLGYNKIYLKDVLQCKIIVSFRGYDLNYFKLEEEDVYKEVWSKADGLHFLGKDLYNRALKRGLDKTYPNYYFISPAIYHDVFKRKNEVGDIDKVHPISIISVGRVVWKKGISYGILAFKKFLDEGGEGHYHIVGVGAGLEEVKFTIHELGLKDKVTLHGKLMPEETKERLEEANVFLHPAISEGFCNAVIEAQAMELPVICTDADGLSENIEHNKTGFVVNKWDSGAMAARLIELYKNPKLRCTFGRNGRKRVLEHFTVDKHAQAFDKMYKDIYEL